MAEGDAPFDDLQNIGHNQNGQFLWSIDLIVTCRGGSRETRARWGQRNGNEGRRPLSLRPLSDFNLLGIIQRHE